MFLILMPTDSSRQDPAAAAAAAMMWVNWQAFRMQLSVMQTWSRQLLLLPLWQPPAQQVPATLRNQNSEQLTKMLQIRTLLWTLQALRALQIQPHLRALQIQLHLSSLQ
jgi:hypothetical protein